MTWCHGSGITSPRKPTNGAVGDLPAAVEHEPGGFVGGHDAGGLERRDTHRGAPVEERDDEVQADADEDQHHPTGAEVHERERHEHPHGDEREQRHETPRRGRTSIRIVRETPPASAYSNGGRHEVRLSILATPPQPEPEADGDGEQRWDDRHRRKLACARWPTTSSTK